MFKKLLEYNWKLFRHSLTGTKVFVLLVYGIFLAVIFSQVISTVFVIITLQTTELGNMFEWYTPQRGQFILLAFANILWLIQFFFTNVRLMKLQENRKLLTMGYPVYKLARYLTFLAFLHPLNLLFNITWLVLLMLQFNNFYYLPVALIVVMVNFSLIFSAKFRVLMIIKNYQKWLLVVFLCVLVLFSASFDKFFTNDFFVNLDSYLLTVNNIAAFLPGGLIAGAHAILENLAGQLVVIVMGGALCIQFHRDHILNIRRSLQSHTAGESSGNEKEKTGVLRNWLCTQCGNHAGKYLYYVITHPYNKIQALIFVAFPILYVPFMLSRIDELGTSRFIVLFFFMYAPMGFQLMFLGNMFGYEHRELLKEIQFPVSLKRQLKQRFQGALILPLTLLIIVTGAEVILLKNGNLLSVVLGNILIFEIFLLIFLWSTFHRLKVVEWVSFSFSQPVISQSVQIMAGLLMMALSAAVYISYGSFELYKQIAMLILILASGFWIYRYIDNIQQAFTSNITPHLWIKL